MKSPLKKSIGEVVTDYGAKVMKVFKEGLLGRSLFDFYGDVKALTFRTKEVTTVPTTPPDGKGGVIYTKSADGKLYYKSNEVAEVELSAADTVLTSEQVQDVVGAMFTSNTETRISATYEDSDGTIDLVVDAIPVDLTVDGAGTIHANNVPTLNQNTSGTAAGLSSTLTVGSGGTGATTFTDNAVLTGNGTSAIQAEAGLIYNGENLTISSSSTSAPDIILKATSNTPAPSNLIFNKDRGSSTAADNDVIGAVTFLSESDSGAAKIYATIVGEIAESSSGSEGGRLEFNISSHDGELKTALKLEDGDAEDEVDVTIGSESTSVTTIAGTLTMGSTATLDNNGNLLNNAATATLATNAQGIVGATDGDVNITSDGNVTVKLDADDDESNQAFKVTQNDDTEIFTVAETGVVTFTNTLLVSDRITNTTTDNDLTIESDGSMDFVLDKDSDETGQSFSFKNGAAEVANIAESGDLTIIRSLTYSSLQVIQNAVKVTLSTSDCNSLHTTPVQIVGAQGANKVIVPTSGMIRVDRALTQSNSSADLNFHYADQEPGTPAQSVVCHYRRFMYNESGDRVFHLGPAFFYVEVSQNLTDDVNKALEVSVDSAFTSNCFTSVEIYLAYKVFDIS
tara:strand:- start:210 stop:2084 length:1875 start_codon:yes stop_codon:yes gene_type:complete